MNQNLDKTMKTIIKVIIIIITIIIVSIVTIPLSSLSAQYCHVSPPLKDIPSSSLAEFSVNPGQGGNSNDKRHLHRA